MKIYSQFDLSISNLVYINLYAWFVDLLINIYVYKNFYKYIINKFLFLK